MRFNATLFVEGIADLVFIIDFVRKRFDYTLEKGREIREMNGIGKLVNYAPNFKESSFLGKTNLLVVDADDSPLERRQNLELQKEQLQIDCKTFLMPNDSDTGNLETLLRNIAVFPKLFNCIETYKICIEALRVEELRPLDEKTKIFIYASSFHNSGRPKEGERDYLQSIWNMESEYLNRLYDFLKDYFVED
jgi:hypothetical protein